MLIIGGRDMEAGAVSVRLHHGGPQGVKPRAEVVADILASIKDAAGVSRGNTGLIVFTTGIALKASTERGPCGRWAAHTVHFEISRSRGVMAGSKFRSICGQSFNRELSTALRVPRCVGATG